MSSAAPSPARSRVTDTLQTLVVLGMDVAFAGERCALHLHTPQGTVKALMPLQRFLEAARVPHDCNGNAFPALVKEPSRFEQMAARAGVMLRFERVAPPAAPEQPRKKRVYRQKDAAREADLRAAWQRYISDPALRLEALAKEMYSYPQVLRRNFNRFAAEAGAPALKPNGKLA